MAMILKDGGMWEPTEEQIQKWMLLYPKVQVTAELNAMIGWLDASPTRRKTKAGMSRFCNSWLKRAQDKGGQGMAKERKVGDPIPTRSMSTLDDLTMDFMDCPKFRAKMLQKHGQWFSATTGRYTE